MSKITRATFTIAILFALLVYAARAQDKPSPTPELNTILMESTFRIHGPSKVDASKISFGTAFLMGKPTPDATKLYYVLITAAHVLESIAGENGTLTLREKHSKGSYTQKLWSIKLRDKDKALYVKHNDLDVVALYVNMPDDLNVPILPIGLLADDDLLRKFEIHPGDELLCLGFPLFVSSEGGFPILRSGKIASYPIIPANIYKSILFGFRVFEGNSGGPVYFVDHGRTYGGIMHLAETEQFVVGLVTSQLGSMAYNNHSIGGSCTIDLHSPDN
jgi:Trypsin-like peptidase domain